MHFQGAQFNFGGMILEKMGRALTDWKNNPTGSYCRVIRLFRCAFGMG